MENEAMATGARNTSTPTECIRGIQRAINQHDLDALTACFAPDYHSEFPVHLDRAFRGHVQMRKNWSQMFGGVPDIHAELLRTVADGDTVWAEWEWTGAQLDGARFWMRGVTIQRVRQGRVVWARLYMEPVQAAGAGSDAAVAHIVVGGQPAEDTSGPAAVSGR